MMYPKPLTEEAFLSAISDDIYMGNDDFVPLCLNFIRYILLMMCISGE